VEAWSGLAFRSISRGKKGGGKGKGKKRGREMFVSGHFGGTASKDRDGRRAAGRWVCHLTRKFDGRGAYISRFR